MNQPLSKIRLIILSLLLVLELALVIALWNSAWLTTNLSTRSLAIGVASIIPILMTVVLLYRVRISLRHRQFSLRALMAFTFIVATFLTLYSLSSPPKKTPVGPLPISKSVKLEVFIAVSSASTNGPISTDTNTGENLQATNPPIVTTTDVSTIQLKPSKNGQNYESILFTLIPTSGKKLLNATNLAKGSKIVVALNGQVLATPKISYPVGQQFQLTGGKITTDALEIFKVLTGTQSNNAGGTN